YPTGDKTMQAGDANLVDKITLSIMRVMFMRGYRNQHMGAEADRLQDAISGVQATVQPSVATSMLQPVSNAPTGFVGAMGKLFGLTPATTPVTPVAADSDPSVPVIPEVDTVATESIDARGLNPAQALKFEELRAWRKEQAAVEGKSGYSYAVLPDKTLINLCLASPQTPADLLRVSGIGQDKAGKYGEDILGIMGG
ncbi:MAG TPA: HRDC domain-containing protein, partial [Anaerolineaceae bacterium]|nr:HRDC domain-containing protein [Anaerolineaceae bacterium]